MEKTRRTHKWQSFLAFALAFVMMLSMMPMQAFAAEALPGAGTKEDPYLIASAEDLELVRAGLKSGDYKGQYLKLTQDITMPQGWTPLSGKGEKFFAGHLDGAGHTLTFPAGSKPLFQTVHGMVLSNLNIYAPYMDGYAVVDQHKQVGGGLTAEFRNVNLKAGSAIKKGGYIGGYASGSDVVNFYDCTVEQNVRIGVNADGSSSNLDYVGSFTGRSNGTLKNCISYANVFGKSRVGGIQGGIGQTMGTQRLENCQFYGNVTATGTMVGGILGAAYSDTEWGVAPNSPSPELIGCKATGNVMGKDRVGGILGCDLTLQCWDNGIGKIQNNVFEGHVQGSGRNVGAIVGFIQGIDKYNIISGNVYDSDCGARTGAGFIKYVDTSCATHETASGAVYFDTSKAIPTIPAEDIGKGWGKGIINKNHNRTDDPLGADAEKLWQAKAAPVIAELEVSGTYKTAYYVDEVLDLTGLTLTAVWTDGSTTEVALEDAAVTGFDSSVPGKVDVTIAYGGCTVVVPMVILADPEVVMMEFSGEYKTEYLVGEELDRTGMIVTVTWDDGTSREVPAEEINFIGFDTSVPGDLYIMVEYGGCYGMLFFTVVEAPVELPFTDVPEDRWYHDYVEKAYADGIMVGINGKEFQPLRSLNRAEFAQILYNVAGKPETKGENPFTDVKAGAWYYDAVVWAAGEGFVAGYGKGTFAPAKQVTRQEMISMLWRYAGQPKGEGDMSGFADLGQMAKYAAPAMTWAVGEDIVSGNGNGRLNPAGNALRAEVARIMVSYLEIA